MVFIDGTTSTTGSTTVTTCSKAIEYIKTNGKIVEWSITVDHDFQFIMDFKNGEIRYREYCFSNWREDTINYLNVLGERKLTNKAVGPARSGGGWRVWHTLSCPELKLSSVEFGSVKLTGNVSYKLTVNNSAQTVRFNVSDYASGPHIKTGYITATITQPA